MSDRAARGGVDAGLAVTTAASAMALAIRAATITGAAVPGWAGTVAGLLDDWSWQLAVQGGRTAGQAGTAGTSGVVWRPPPDGVLAGDAVPAAPLSAHPLTSWLRLRLGVRRCLACGHLGTRSLQPAHPLVPPARARTWWCTDRVGCRERRTRQDERW